MLSNIVKVPSSDQFNSGNEWERIVFDHKEFLQAIGENSVEFLVREVLRPRYGSSPIFHSIVADVLKAVLDRVVDKLRPAISNHALAVLFVPKEIEEVEKRRTEKVAFSGAPAYWQGEACQ